MSTLDLILTALLAITPQAGSPEQPVIYFLNAVPFDFVRSNNAPDFVLYGDGTAIYQIEDSVVATVDTEATYPRFATAHLDSASIASLMELAGSKEFLALAPRYDLDPTGTEWDIDVLQVWSAGQTTRVWVRGPRGRWPPPFAALVARVNHFHQQPETPWLPGDVEIELTRVERPCVQSAPVAWPTTLSPPTGSLDSMVVRYRVPVAQLHEVQRLWRRSSRGWACTPIAIGSSLWTMEFRYPLPGEAAWTRR